MFAIFSYRVEGKDEWHGPYQAYECYDTWGSDLILHNAKNVEELIHFLANRISEKPLAEYVNLVYDRWEDVLSHGRYGLEWSRQGDGSIYFHTGYEEETPEEKARKKDLENYVRQDVAVLLQDAALRKKQQEEEARHQQQLAEQERKDREKETHDQKEYQRLKAKYEEGRA